MVSYVNNVHDERYKCVNRECQRTDLEPDAVNMEKWTCKTCKKPVHVKIKDAGRPLWVKRIRAKAVKAGTDMVYLPHKFDRAFQVKTSAKGTGKDHSHQWMLVLADNGSTLFRMPDDYVDVDA